MSVSPEARAGIGDVSLERRRMALEHALLQLAAEAARAEDTNAMADALVRGLVSHAGALTAEVHLVDDERRELRCIARSGGDGAGVRTPLDATRAEATAVRTRELLHASLPSGADSVTIPLINATTGIGAIATTFPHRLAPDEMVALRALADICTVVVARAAMRATITEHERFERSLRATARRFRASFDQTFQLAWMLTADGTVVDVNAAAIDVIGWPASAMLGRPMWEAAAWVRAPGFDAALRQRVARAARGESVRCEVECATANGSKATLDLSVKPVTDEAGHLAFLLAEGRDVTARKNAEDARKALASQIEREREWLRAVIEHAPVGIVLVEDGTGNRVRMNPRARRLLGVRGDDGELEAEGARLVSAALAGELTEPREITVTLAEAKEAQALVSGETVRDPDGTVTGAVVLCEDVSALKKLQRLREEWTSVIAHDLRQPLTAIELQASRLVRGANVNPASCANHILAATRLLDRMISELWDLAAVEGGQLSLKPVETDVTAMTRAVLDRFGWQVGNHALKFHEDPGTTVAAVDPQRFEQILWNLVANAGKYGYPDTEILVDLAHKEREVEISVTNRGDGIDAEAQKRIFDRFHRLESSRRGRERGLGLGLYISKQLTEAQGGRIWVESTKGDTTTFHFTVPLLP